MNDAIVGDTISVSEWREDLDRTEAEERALHLEWTRANAARIEQLINAPFASDVDNTRIYRALYWCDDHMVAASIHQLQGGDPPLFVQIQIGHNAHDRIAPSVQQLRGPHMTPTEIAVFFGLDNVNPDYLAWREQEFRHSVIHVVRGKMEGLKH